MLSISKLMNNPANESVLAYLAENRLIKLPPVPRNHKTAVLEADLWPDDEVSPFDEGGIVFIHDYGHAVPFRAKYSFDLIHAFIHDESGEIFAVHWGRLTIVLRYDAARADFDDHDDLRATHTLDGPIDARALGPGWALAERFVDDIDEALQFAWEAADARAAGAASGSTPPSQ